MPATPRFHFDACYSTHTRYATRKEFEAIVANWRPELLKREQRG